MSSVSFGLAGLPDHSWRNLFIKSILVFILSIFYKVLIFALTKDHVPSGVESSSFAWGLGEESCAGHPHIVGWGNHEFARFRNLFRLWKTTTRPDQARRADGRLSQLPDQGHLARRG